MPALPTFWSCRRRYVAADAYLLNSGLTHVFMRGQQIAKVQIAKVQQRAKAQQRFEPDRRRRAEHFLGV